MPRDAQTAGGRQAQTQRQTTADEVLKNRVKGVVVDDGFIFAGGTEACFQEAELNGNLMSDLTGALLQRAADMQALRKDFHKLQADFMVELFGPQEEASPTEEECAVVDGK